MVPPRLSIVGADPEADPENGDTGAPPASSAPANDAAPEPDRSPDAAADGETAAPAALAAGSASPVHDLIATLSAAPLGDQPAAERREKLRILEAVLFAASEPLAEDRLRLHLKAGDDVAALLAELQASYAGRGINLVRLAGKWTFRTAEDLSWVLERHTEDERKLSKAALETLAIIAYHQPVTRAEIEEIRGVTTSKGTLDVLMETVWIRPRGRRRAPGRPVTYGTTDKFLEHFGLDAIKDLPGLAELKGSGLLDANLPPDFKVPEPTDVAALMPDELPLEAGGDDEDSQPELELEEPLEQDDDAGESAEKTDHDERKQ